MLTFYGPQKLPTTCTSLVRTHSLSGTARSWPSHSLPRLRPSAEKHARIKDGLPKLNDTLKEMKSSGIAVAKCWRGVGAHLPLCPLTPGCRRQAEFPFERPVERRFGFVANLLGNPDDRS